MLVVKAYIQYNTTMKCSLQYVYKNYILYIKYIVINIIHINKTMPPNTVILRVYVFTYMYIYKF